jgi:hypothetical protein
MMWIFSTVVPITGVFSIFFGIVKDDKSRHQIGALLHGKGLWPQFNKTIKDLHQLIVDSVGPRFSFRSFDITLAVAFFFVVVSLSTSEILGSSLFIGNATLLVRKIKFPGAGIIIGGFSALLVIMVLILWNRQKIMPWIAKIFKEKTYRMTYALVVYWVTLISGWSLLAIIVWTFSSKELFNSCLIIGCLAIFGSINRSTRVISLATIFILPFAILIFRPSSSIGLILSFLNVIITPVKGIWDWLSIGIMITLLHNLIFNQPTHSRILKFLLLNLLWACLVMIGLPFILALVFRFYNLVMTPLGVPQIEWRLFYDQGFNAPLGKGLFFSTICITSVIPAIINICAGCIALLVMPLPGKDSIYTVCMKDKPTALDRTILATYLSVWLVLLIMGAIIVAVFLWILVTSFGKQTFFAVLDLVKQLI